MDKSVATIMVVDDELFFRQLLRNICEKEGYTVVAEAADGAEAVEKYRALRPKVTIVDIFMPEKNGIDATREIMEIDSAANVLVCSGTGFEEDIEAALAAGAKGIIYKPFVPGEILDLIAGL